MIYNEAFDSVHFERLFDDVKKQYPPAEDFLLRVSFYPYKHLSHTVRLRNQVIYLRLSDRMQNAPDAALQAITIILFDKLFHYRTHKQVRETYKNYASTLERPVAPIAHRDVFRNYTAVGIYYNLDAIFDRVNIRYFDGGLKKPHLGWSHRRSYRRLGFYSDCRNLLVVSRIFDHKKCPDYVLEFIMYHEMLHVVIPIVHKKQRRIVHSAEFKKREQEFYHYEKAQRFLKKRLRRLL